MSAKNVTIVLKRGLKANLAAAMEDLKLGEPAYTTDSHELFVGDGDGGADPVVAAIPNVGTAGTYKSVTTDPQGRVIAGANPTTLVGFGIVDAAPLSHVGAGGVAHANATQLVAGFMSEADKIALDDFVAEGVQANVIEGVIVDGVTLTPDSVKKVEIPKATAAQVGVALLGATGGSARYGQKGDVGLGNVDNTTDVAKPISIATQAALDLKEDTDNKGIANGYASLDANAKVPIAQLPDAVVGAMIYGGTFVPSTAVATLSHNAQERLDTAAATITLTNDTTQVTGFAANQDIFYLASADGNLFGKLFAVGDWLVSTGSGWEKIDNNDAVVSVNGKVGAVTLAYMDVGAAPENASLAADTGIGTDVTTGAVASASLATILQAIWAKIRQVANVASAKQGAITSVIGNDNASTANTTTTGAVTIPIPVTTVAATSSATQQAAGTNALRTVIQTLINNIANLFANKADIASPAFTGTPTAPTAAVGTDTTQLATTAFVISEINLTAPANVALAAETGTGTDVTTPAVSSATVQSVLQTIWGKIRQVANVASSKQGEITSIVGNDNASAANEITTGEVTVPVPVTTTLGTSNSTQLATGTNPLRTVIQRILDNIAYFFTNAVVVNDTLDGGTF